jgi:hypothetical protein
MMAVPVVFTPPQQKSRGCGYYLGVVAAGFLVLIALGYFIEQVKPKPSPAEKAAKQKEQAALVFAAAGAKNIRNAMRNPDSFKLAQVLMMHDGAVCYEFRSQNGFGGMNVGHAVLSPSGQLRTNETSGFGALWNKECADKTGIDETEQLGYVTGFGSGQK